MSNKIRKKRGCKVWVNVAIEIGGKILPSLQYRVKVLRGAKFEEYTTTLPNWANIPKTKFTKTREQRVAIRISTLQKTCIL